MPWLPLQRPWLISLQINLPWYSLGCKVSLLLSFCIFLCSKGDSSPSCNPTLAPPHLLPPSPTGITWIHLTFSISAGPKSIHNPHMSTILPSPVLCSQIAIYSKSTMQTQYLSLFCWNLYCIPDVIWRRERNTFTLLEICLKSINLP